LVPEDAVPLLDEMWAYGALDQLDKLKSAVEESRKLGYTGTELLMSQMQAEAELGNDAEVQRLTNEVAGRPDEYEFLNSLALTQTEQGRFKAATESWKKGVQSAHESHAPDVEAAMVFSVPVAGWTIGQCGDFKGGAKLAQTLAHSRLLDEGDALTLTLCGDKSGLPRMAELSRKYPQDTLQVNVWEPESKAWLLLKDGHAQEALAELEKGRRYEGTTPGAWMRGLAYLQLKDAQNAIAAFKDATKYRGAAVWAYYFPLPYAQSLLGLGRAFAMAGDKANAKKAYERFFTEWKNADPDIPDWIAAKKEYAAL
jgi:tetratricopeptide (TPR) repeat protein